MTPTGRNLQVTPLTCCRAAAAVDWRRRWGGLSSCSERMGRRAPEHACGKKNLYHDDNARGRRSNRRLLELRRFSALPTEEGDPLAGADAIDSTAVADDENVVRISNLGILALWAGFALYAFVFSPNAASVTDRTMLESILNFGAASEGYTSINKVFLSEFWLMGSSSMVYASLLLPTGKSSNNVPAWPFVLASVFLGTFALLPYFAVWTPSKPSQVCGQSKTVVTKVLESKLWARSLAAYTGKLSISLLELSLRCFVASMLCCFVASMLCCLQVFFQLVLTRVLAWKVALCALRSLPAMHLGKRSPSSLPRAGSRT